MTHDPTAALRAAQAQLIAMQVGGCTCGAKTPDLHFHDARCRYRQAAECQENVDEALAALAAARAALDQPAGEVEPAAHHHIDVTDRGLVEFAEWFRKNYPGPDTIIHKPDWHSPRIYRAAVHAVARAHPPAAPDAEEIRAAASELDEIANSLQDPLRPDDMHPDDLKFLLRDAEKVATVAERLRALSRTAKET